MTRFSVAFAALVLAAGPVAAQDFTQTRSPTAVSGQLRPWQTGETFNLWPEGAHPPRAGMPPEQVSVTPDGTNTFVRNVSVPTLTVFRPAAGTATGAAIIIAPGGGFSLESIETEGTQVAEALAARGVTAFVLKYRLPATPTNDGEMWAELISRVNAATEVNSPGAPALPGAAPAAAPAPQEDRGAMAKEDSLGALALVRARAVEFGIDPAKVGFMGFSAGAQLTADMLASDQAGHLAWAAMIYGGEFEPREPTLNAVVPTFLAVSGDDNLAAPTALRMFEAVRKKGGKAELHVFSGGGHGYGMVKQGKTSDHWIDEYILWLATEGFATRS